MHGMTVKKKRKKESNIECFFNATARARVCVCVCVYSLSKELHVIFVTVFI